MEKNGAETFGGQNIDNQARSHALVWWRSYVPSADELLAMGATSWHNKVHNNHVEVGTLDSWVGRNS